MGQSKEQPKAGWYQAAGDPPESKRYWNGSSWHSTVLNQSDSIGDGSVRLPADMYDRVMARFIDLCIWVCIYVLFETVEELAFDSLSYEVTRSIVIFGSALSIGLYEIVSLSVRGSTFGKSFVGLEVVSEGSAGLSFMNFFKRIILLIVISILSLGFGIAVGFSYGYLLFVALAIFFVVHGLFQINNDPKRKTIWDDLSDTLVVKL